LIKNKKGEAVFLLQGPAIHKDFVQLNRVDSSRQGVHLCTKKQCL